MQVTNDPGEGGQEGGWGWGGNGESEMERGAMGR